MTDKEMNTKVFAKKLLEWCWKNNTMPLKELMPEKYADSKLSVSSLDGGWVNVLKLKKEMERLLGEKI